jgi:hypothetical protein
MQRLEVSGAVYIYIYIYIYIYMSLGGKGLNAHVPASFPVSFYLIFSTYGGGTFQCGL